MLTACSGVGPFYVNESVTLYHGDALAVLPQLEDGSVDAVITDPPYSSGGMVRGDRMNNVHTKYVQTGSAIGKLQPSFTGDNRDQRSYGYWCALWLGECLRITKEGGVCCMFTDWRQLPATTDALQAGGWVWRGVLPWHKPAGRSTQGRLANNCEYVVWGTAGPRAMYDGTFETLPGFLQANPVRDRVHIAEKPLSVLRVLTRLAPKGGLVLDPFAGSGTTGLAALAERRRFVGVELVEAHCETAAARLAARERYPVEAQEVLELDRF